ncbi:heme-thiolate peroxidase [Mycena floridula]|nr:heme-thiolate peroxidase [Mycena floridula]
MLFNVILSLAPAAALGSFVSTLPPSNRWHAPGPGDVRSPCPALNTLANHGFLPRDGKNITATEFHDAIQAGYNISDDLVATLIGAGVACCTNANSSTIDLNKLALHNAIEHDASLVHDNANGATFAPTRVNQTLVHEVVQTYPQGLVLNDFAQLRVKRESTLTTPLDSTHTTIAYGESSMTWLFMQNSSGIVPAQTFQEWFGGERFPEQYVYATVQVTTEILQATIGELATDIATIRAA